LSGVARSRSSTFVGFIEGGANGYDSAPVDVSDALSSESGGVGSDEGLRAVPFLTPVDVDMFGDRCGSALKGLFPAQSYWVLVI